MRPSPPPTVCWTSWDSGSASWSGGWLCQTTLAEIEADVRRLVEQTRDQLLEEEQRLVGWEARDPP